MIKKGQTVRFEMNKRLQLPRWDFEIDRGASGKFVEKVVVFADDDIFAIKYDDDKDNDPWTFPQGNFFNRPGWPILVEDNIMETKPGTCTCSISNLKLHGCNCGAIQRYKPLR